VNLQSHIKAASHCQRGFRTRRGYRMNKDLTNRRAFLRRIRDWALGGLYSFIPLNWFSHGVGNHLTEIDTEKSWKTAQRDPCNCKEDHRLARIARGQAPFEPSGCGCACKSLQKKGGVRDKSASPQNQQDSCACRPNQKQANVRQAQPSPPAPTGQCRCFGQGWGVKQSNTVREGSPDLRRRR